MRLTAKFIIAFIFIVFIPVITLGYLSYYSAKSALQKQALEDLTLVAETKEGHIYSFFEAIKDRAMDFSSDGFMLDTVEAMQNLDAENSRFMELQKSLNSHLRLSKMSLDETIQLILVIDSSGNVVAATDGREIVIDESDDEYFLEGSEGVYLGDVHRSSHFAGSGRPYKIAVSAPLMSRENKAFLGVIVNYYDTGELDKILSGEFQVEKGAMSGNRGRGETLDIYLVNREKLLITPSRSSGEVMKQRIETLPVRECGGGREITSIYTNHYGDEVIGASMCMPGMGWTLLVEVNTNEAFAPVAALRARTILLGVVIELLAFILAYFFAKRIISPVVVLSRLTRNLARGDFSVRVPVESKDEIGELADSFNKMAVRLAESRHAILTEKSRLEALINGIDDGIALSDSDDNVVILNRSAENLFGIKTSDIVGKPVADCHKHSMKRVEEVLEAFKRGTKKHYVSETTYKSMDFEITASSINRENAYFGAVMIAHDITERKQAERELHTRASQQAAVAELGQVALEGEDLGALMERTVSVVAKTLDMQYCKILELLPDGQALLLRAGVGWKEGCVGRETVDAGTESQAGYTLVSGKPLIVEDIQNEIRFKAPPLLVDHGVVSGMSVIIPGREKAFGILGTHAAVKRAFRPDDVHFLQSVSNVLAEAIARKQTENELLVRQDELYDKHEELSVLFRQMEITKGEWERTMDCMGDMVILADGDSRIRRCNTAVKKFIEKTYDKILGKEWEGLLREHGMNPDAFDAQGTEIFHEFTGRWFVFKSYPYTKAAGYEVSGTVITIHDSTELKLVMEELEQKSIEIDKNREKLQKALSEISFLIQQVAEQENFSVRYAEPELKQPDFDPIYQLGDQFNNMMHILASKNKELEDAYEKLKATQTQILQHDKMASIGQLAAGVAHEINNPMGFISSNIGTLEKYVGRLVEFISAQSNALESLKAVETLEKLNNTRKKLKLDYIVKDIKDLIKESLDGADRVRIIVQNLKSFSRVDEAEKKHVDINECIESTITIVWNELKYKTTLTKEYGELPPTKCYPQQLNQVFMNLLVNAAHAIEKQGEIKIKTWHEDGFVYASVSDTGHGIPDDELGRIFEPFFTTKEVGKGTGLGLSITYDIVKKHDGDIFVESEVGKGTTFTVRLPVNERTEN